MKIVFRSIIYLFIFLFIGNVNAQDETIFAPIGATWIYSTTKPNELLTFSSVGDTIINGYNARKIECYITQNENFIKIDSLTKYVSTIGSKVYYWVSNKFVLLYDFEANLGDTIHSEVERFPIEMGCNSDFSNGVIEFSYTIDDIDSITYDNIVLRTQSIHILGDGLSPSWNFSEPITERIGQLNSRGFWWGRGDECIFEYSGFLRCYHDLDLSVRSEFFNNNLDCDSINTSLSDPGKFEKLEFYPNPSSNLIYLSSSADKITIYNFSGENILTCSNKDIIDISKLSSGLYFIICKIGDEYKYNTFIKFN